MSSTQIAIQSTFDVALARHQLRKQMAEEVWPPPYRARAAAALTTLTEIVLRSQTPAVLIISTLQKTDSLGLGLSCNIRWQAAQDDWLAQARHQLERAADQVEIADEAGHTRIDAYLWLPHDQALSASAR